jgi:hypothetical protein
MEKPARKYTKISENKKRAGGMSDGDSRVNHENFTYNCSVTSRMRSETVSWPSFEEDQDEELCLGRRNSNVVRYALVFSNICTIQIKTGSPIDF